jgi:hypothetical protein
MSLFNGKSRIYLGVDPGSSGALCVLSEDKETFAVWKTPAAKDPVHEWLDLTREISDAYKVFGCFVEAPNVGVGGAGKKGKQGTTQLVKQGVNIAYAKMAVAAAQIPFTPILPSSWTSNLSLKRGKTESQTAWKSRLYELAKRFYPGFDFPKYAADAVLIAEICRRYDGVKPSRNMKVVDPNKPDPEQETVDQLLDSAGVKAPW